MWVHVGHMSIRAKSHDPDGHRIAEMAKKNHILDFSSVFWVFFCGKTVIKIEAGIQNSAWRNALTLRTCMLRGKDHWSCLGIPAPNSPGCPKIQNFETFFCQLWKVFLAFWVIVPSWNFGIRFVHLLRTNTPSGHLDFTFFPRVSHFSKLGVNFRTQFLDFLAKKWKIYKIF